MTDLSDAPDGLFEDGPIPDKQDLGDDVVVDEDDDPDTTPDPGEDDPTADHTTPTEDDIP